MARRDAGETTAAIAAALALACASCTGRLGAADGGPAACPAGQSRCAESCVATASDPSNCGGCGNACSRGERCAASHCVEACADADADGYLPLGCGGGDCDDANALVSPGVFEAASLCTDGVDNDCDGAVDGDAPGCRSCAGDEDCLDLNLCNGSESCVGGSCVGGIAPSCDDGNACTDDDCVPTTGCAYIDNVAPCDDGLACTSGDTCTSGACAGVALGCDDGDACTDDVCDDAGGCSHVDGSGRCDDANPCTDDACDPASGCAHVANSAPCSDGSACTSGDACAGGSCVGGAVVSCDDGNPCTDDACDPAGGCARTHNAALCDDSDPCNGADSCDSGTCSIHIGSACGNSVCDCGELSATCASDCPSRTLGCLGRLTPAPGSGRFGFNDDWGIAAPGFNECRGYMLAREAGMSWVRYTLYWYNLQDATGAINWAAADEAISGAVEAGLNVFATIGWPSAYAVQPDRPRAYGPFNCMDPATLMYDPGRDFPNCQPGTIFYVDRFQAFVRAAVARYGAIVRHWGFANEWHNPVFWRSGDVHANLFVPGYDAAHAEALARGYVIEVVGPGEDVPRYFEENLVAERAHGRRMWDVLDFHSYADPISAFEPLYTAYRDFGGPREVWMTEGGVPSGTDAASLASQASSLTSFCSTVSGAMASSGLDRFFLYRLRGGGEAPLSPDYGILFGSNRPKPAYYAVRGLLCPGDDCAPVGIDVADLVGAGAWYFAEGGADLGIEMDSRYAIYNDTALAVPLLYFFLDERGRATQYSTTVPPWDRVVIRLPEYRPSGGYAAVFAPQGGGQVFASRMTFVRDRGGGHLSAGTTVTSPTWYFAEGSAASFDNYFTFVNPNAAAATATATYYRTDGIVAGSDTVTVPAHGRATLFADANPGVAALDFSTEISASAPLIAERSMYWSDFGAGTNTVGATAPSTTFYFPEGLQTSTGWHTYFLVSNPAASPVTAWLTLARDGASALGPYRLDLPAHGRGTLWAGSYVTDAGFAAEITAASPIVAERAMYWGGFAEGHVTVGAPTRAREWFFPEGRALAGEVTHFLIYNPNAAAVTVVVTLLGSGPSAVGRYTIAGGARQNVAVPATDFPTFAGRTFSATVKVETPGAVGSTGVVAEQAIYWNSYADGAAMMGIAR